MRSNKGQCNKHGKAEARKRSIQLVMFLAPVISYFRIVISSTENNF
jgi:hypothetical protein